MRVIIMVAALWSLVAGAQAALSSTAIRQELVKIDASIREVEYKLRQQQNEVEREKLRDLCAEVTGRAGGLSTYQFRQSASSAMMIDMYQRQLRALESQRVQLQAVLSQMESAPANAAPTGGANGVKFCTECGAKTHRSAKFCPQCGNRLLPAEVGGLPSK